jgi:UDP:flavonoid glycosyltransferase YjiC (YdhE family)
MSPPKRILLATLGSLGDLHPMLALGLELKQRGHHVTVATTEAYRGKVESIGLHFHRMRPDWDPTDPELIAKCEDLKTGPEVLLRELVLPHLRESHRDLLTAAEESDYMITSELCFGAPLIAEQLRLPWASVILSPTSFFSAYDPSLLVNAPSVYRLRRAGWLVNRTILELGKLASRHWWTPVRELRRDLGLNPDCDPLFRDKYSPRLVLALFGRSLALSQPDWPKQTVQPGFAFFDKAPETEIKGQIDATIEAFLSAGPPPIVFTLGSTAVHNPGSFFEASLEAARQLGQRALLIGFKQTLSETNSDALAVAYAPYSEVFSRAAAIVHQGGSGTTGQSLRAGRPQLIIPYGWDQPDNGARIARSGAGLTLARSAYTAESAAATLSRLLGDPRFAQTAQQAAAEIAVEDAVKVACDTVEDALFNRQSVSQQASPYRQPPESLPVPVD